MIVLRAYFSRCVVICLFRSPSRSPSRRCLLGFSLSRVQFRAMDSELWNRVLGHGGPVMAWGLVMPCDCHLATWEIVGSQVQGCPSPEAMYS